jgi:hypothetical protein
VQETASYVAVVMSVSKRCWLIERVVGTKVTLLGSASDKALTSHAFADVIIGVDDGMISGLGPSITLTVDGHLFFDKLNLTAAMGAQAAASDPSLGTSVFAAAADSTQSQSNVTSIFDGPQGLSIKASKAVVKSWSLQPWDDRPQPIARFAFDPRQPLPAPPSAYGLPPAPPAQRAGSLPRLPFAAADSGPLTVQRAQPALGLPQLALGEPRRLGTGNSNPEIIKRSGQERGSSAPQVNLFCIKRTMILTFIIRFLELHI